MHGMTMCRKLLVCGLCLMPAAGAAQQLSPGGHVSAPGSSPPAPSSPAAPAPRAPAAAVSATPLPTVPRAILGEWIARVERDSAVWAQCLRGSIDEARGVVVAEVVEAVGQRIENGSLRYGCPAGSIGSAHSFTPGIGESCAASDSERDAFYAGWEQVRVLVCPGPRLLWLVRPGRPAAGRRVAVSPAHPPRALG